MHLAGAMAPLVQLPMDTYRNIKKSVKRAGFLKFPPSAVNIEKKIEFFLRMEYHG